MQQTFLWRRWTVTIAVLAVVLCVDLGVGFAQGLGGAGTIQGTVKDPTGGVMQSVEETIRNAVSGFMRTATTDAAGKYSFTNLPPNAYHLAVEVQGFMRRLVCVSITTTA